MWYLCKFYLLALSFFTFSKLVFRITKMSLAKVLDKTIVSKASALFFKMYAVAFTVYIPRINFPKRFLDMAFS